MNDDFTNELKNSSYSEYLLKKKHQLKNFSLYGDVPRDTNPFEFEAFASINKLATVFNYNIFAVSELKQKDNPFNMMNRDVSIDIKSTWICYLKHENANSLS